MKRTHDDGQPAVAQGGLSHHLWPGIVRRRRRRSGRVYSGLQQMYSQPPKNYIHVKSSAVRGK